MTTAWTESATWRCPDDTDLTNDQADCPQQWNPAASPVPPYEPVPTATHTVNGGDADPIELDVTADVLAGADLGWVIRKTDPTAPGRIRLGSSESGDGPQLILDTVVDDCPADPDKTEPGLCGCGVPDDLTGCVLECPVYTDVLVYMNGIVASQGVSDCYPDLTMTCDGDTIRVSGVSDNDPAPFIAELGRPSLSAYSTPEGSYGQCDGTGAAFVGFAAAGIDVVYACQQYFDEGCAQLPASAP
ncbi:MAG: hypothetical protein K0V04_19485 [Deltaproteobacteria bacterium]|nr:hypothetical protein [Deltaproteobacteria bacterium]